MLLLDRDGFEFWVAKQDQALTDDVLDHGGRMLHSEDDQVAAGFDSESLCQEGVPLVPAAVIPLLGYTEESCPTPERKQFTAGAPFEGDGCGDDSLAAIDHLENVVVRAIFCHDVDLQLVG